MSRRVAVAKIAGIRLCQAYRRQHGCDFVSAMPTNLYGPHDNYDLRSAHVAAALQVKLHQAKVNVERSVTIRGTGSPHRELLYVDDLADALVYMMRRYSEEKHLNVGTGRDLSIHDLAELIAHVGWTGEFVYDTSKPRGVPKKLLDVSKLRALGWIAQVGLEQVMSMTYSWYTSNVARSMSPAPITR